MSVMTHRGYSARVEFDPEDELFVGHIANINDVVGFHADTVESLKAAFHEAVDEYLETCRKAGKSPEKPYSGNLMFRVAPEVHAKAALAAQLSGKSLNQWAEEVLREASGRGLGLNERGQPRPAGKLATKNKPRAKSTGRSRTLQENAATALKRA